MRYLILIAQSLIALLFVHSNLFAQKQNNIWYFGDQAGLDFNTNPPKALTSNLFTLEGTASISDPAGHLLFYTNGATLWDRQHNVMPNGSGLLGGESSTQAALIIPRPNSCQTYYVFMTEDHLTDGGLTYSTVDMCLNNGFGNVVSSEKNILLQNRTAEKITAVLHSNGVDIWVITHKLASNEFLAYLVTSAGINTTPVVSAIGANYPFDAHIGPAKASHNGAKIASSASFRNICELFDFNRSTGILSNQVNLMPLLPSQSFIYGIEFSPNDSLLYLSSFFVTSRLLQLDIASLQLTTLNSIPGNYIYGGLQSGPDNKIYMARVDSSFIDVIHQPDLKGTFCQYEERGQHLATGTKSQSGLPNFAPYSFYSDTNVILSLSSDTSFCMGDSLVLELNAEVNCPTSYLWNDGSTGNVKVVKQSGLYWVEISSSCLHYRDSIQIDVNPAPSTSASINICEGESYEGYTQSGTYTDYFFTIHGCDSIRILELTVNKCDSVPSCITAVGAIYGSPNSNERAKCLLPTPGGDGLYAVGMKEDSVLIVRLNLMGQVIWARAFDIIPGVVDNVSSALIDGEGMILTEGIAGDYNNGGNIFAFRYDPITNQILWAKEYVNSSMRSYTFPVTQTVNGDYLLGCNPHPPFPAAISDSELLQVSKANGNPVTGLDKVYHLGGSDEFTELVLYQGFIYGCGRYTDGAPNNKMRHTLMKFDPATLNQVWVKCGHVAQSGTARLYARDLIIDADIIYSLGLGDPVGTSSTITIQYLQKTDINGNLIWVKRYDLPGTNDWGHQIIKSGGGLVVLAGKLAAPSNIFLYKTDLDGAMLWGKEFQFSPPIITAIQVDRGNSQLIEVGGQLFLTATGVTTNGSTDILIIRMDLDGNTDMPCVTSIPVSIPVIPVQSPVFYSVNPTTTNGSQSVNSETPAIIETPFTYREECVISDTIFEIIDTIICSGETFEGYSIAGIYEDSFVTSAGCDSLRTLDLDVYNPNNTSEQSTICLGESFNGYSTSGVYTNSYINVFGCDSFHTLTLNVIPLFSTIEISICQGETYLGYTQQGIYEDTLQGPPNACDTLRQLTLTVLPIFETIISKSICTGKSFEGYGSSGTYIDTFQTVDGCDSVRILQLIVSDTIVTSSIVDICFGQSYEGYSIPGFYVDTFQSSAGCDSLRQLTLQIEAPEKHILAEICAGQHFEQYSSSGIYFDTLPGISGDCDTLRELNLIVQPVQVTQVEEVICDGESYLGYSQAGIFIDTLTTIDGCDSVRELHLQTLNPATQTILTSICEQVLTHYAQPGVYTDTLVSYQGCDSIVRYVIEDAGLYIPNVFSPNNDGINDVFTVFPFPAPELSIDYFGIFDRFGDMVYETEKWPILWHGDGRDGKLFQPGVFTYVLIYHCSDEQLVQHGNVTLVK